MCICRISVTVRLWQWDLLKRDWAVIPCRLPWLSGFHHLLVLKDKKKKHISSSCDTAGHTYWFERAAVIKNDKGTCRVLFIKELHLAPLSEPAGPQGGAGVGGDSAPLWPQSRPQNADHSPSPDYTSKQLHPPKPPPHTHTHTHTHTHMLRGDN